MRNKLPVFLENRELSYKNIKHYACYLKQFDKYTIVSCYNLKDDKYDISQVHRDCGIEIYDGKTQGTGAGGSGCGCSAVTLSAYYLKQVEQGALKRILFVPTGALLSTVSFNEGMSVPGIAHAVVIEYVEE